MSAQTQVTKDMEAQHELNKNMEVDDWEDEWEQDMEQADDMIHQSVQDDWEDEEEQVRALVKKTLIQKEKEDKKKAEVAGKVAAKVAAKKAKYENFTDQELDFGKFEYVRILLKTKKEKIQEDQVYGAFSLTMKASVMHAIDASINALSQRITKMNCAISECSWAGGDEGDVDEIGVRKEHSKKLVKQFTTIWRSIIVINAARDLSNSLNGFVKVGKQTPTDELESIMKSIHDNKSVSRCSSACASSACASSACASSACASSAYDSADTSEYNTSCNTSVCVTPCEHYESVSPVVQNNEHRSECFEAIQKKANEARENPMVAQCTRVCESFKSGEQCRHGERCRFAHSLEELTPRSCAFGHECRKIHAKTGNVCEYSHPQEDGRWETAAEVVARMNLRVPLPSRKVVKVTPVVQTFNSTIAPWVQEKTQVENTEKTQVENTHKTQVENTHKTQVENTHKTQVENTIKYEIMECTYDVAIKMMKYFKETGDKRNIHWKIIEN
jgi:hypothetical protein